MVAAARARRAVPVVLAAREDMAAVPLSLRRPASWSCQVAWTCLRPTEAEAVHRGHLHRLPRRGELAGVARLVREHLTFRPSVL